MSTTSPPPGRHAGARTGRAAARRRRGLTLAIVVLGVLAAVALATWVAAATQPPGRPAPLREDLTLALIMTGSIAVVAGLVWMLAAGTFTSGDLSHIRSASRARRAAATTAIRHGHPVPAEDAELTHALARATARQRATAPIWLGVTASTTGMLLLTWSQQPLEVVAAVMVLVGTAANIPTFVAAARARAWLHTHAPSATVRW